MPVVTIDAPPGVAPEVKKQMMTRINAAVEEAYPLGETLVFLREHALENVAVNGILTAESPQIMDVVKKVAERV